MSELCVIEQALQLCGAHEIVRVPWEPVQDPDQPKGGRLSVTFRLPAKYGVENQFNCFHGTNAYNLIQIRQKGLQVSRSGDGGGQHQLYTCKHRRTPLETYSLPQELPSRTATPGEAPILRKWRVVLGIAGKNEWPHHAKKLARKRGTHTSFCTT